MRLLRSTVTSSIFLKATSLILGFLLWSTISNLFPRSIWIEVPVCFYNTGSYKMRAPETINVELTGKRAYIKQINKDTIALHIDAQSLHSGDNLLTITQEMLLLPAAISVATVIPHKVIVHLTPGD